MLAFIKFTQKSIFESSDLLLPVTSILMTLFGLLGEFFDGLVSTCANLRTFHVNLLILLRENGAFSLVDFDLLLRRDLFPIIVHCWTLCFVLLFPLGARSFNGFSNDFFIDMLCFLCITFLIILSFFFGFLLELQDLRLKLCDTFVSLLNLFFFFSLGLHEFTLFFSPSERRLTNL